MRHLGYTSSSASFLKICHILIFKEKFLFYTHTRPYLQIDLKGVKVLRALSVFEDTFIFLYLFICMYVN